MSTRARIGILRDDGSVLSVYHHWDGYPEWLGVRLITGYNSEQKVMELISGGDMSSCESTQDWNREELNPPRPLYYKERGEDTPPHVSRDENEFVSFAANSCDYAYLFENRKWNVFEL